jgi:hypothetical protein
MALHGRDRQNDDRRRWLSEPERVVIQVVSTTQGLKFALAASGVSLKVKK